MGLFKRRDETRQELEALRAELATMRERLDESENAKQQLTDSLGRVEADHARLTTHVGSVENKVGAVESKVGDVETQVVSVAGSIEPAINNAIGDTAGDVESVRDEVVRLAALAATVEELGSALSEQRSTLPPPMAPPDNDDDDVLAALQQQLDQLAEVIARQHEHIADISLVATDAAERTDTSLVEMRAALDASQRDVVDTETRTNVGLLAEKVGSIEARVNQVSLELTNQLTELSGDIDRAGAHADPSELLDDLVARLDDVTGGQERLATEQARYAIQFREDLAELAERLRRPGSR